MTKPRPWLLLLLVMCALLAGGLSTAAVADDATVSYDNFRTGWDPAEQALPPPTAADFGQLFDTTLPDGGHLFAQPIIAGDGTAAGPTLIAASSSDDVYGLDPVTGAIRWSRSFGKPWSSAVVHCGNAVWGVTSTPVYDAATDTVYIMAKVDDGKDAAHPHWYLHALDPATGQERSGWPVTIGGHPDNDPTRTFNAETAAQRPGLLLLDGVVYAGFASYCDAGPYVGYVVGVSTTSHQQTALWSSEAGTSDGESGIWQSGGGLVSDGPGSIYISTGNGRAAPPSPGSQPPAALGEAVVHLKVAANGTLAADDYFSPVNATALNTDDTDLGAGGPTAIPGTYDGKRLLVIAGKDGRVFLLDRDALGGSGQGPGGTDAVVDSTGPYNGLWGHFAYWAGPSGSTTTGSYLYDVENQGYLRAFQLEQDLSGGGSGTPILSSVATSAGTFGYTSGSPVVTTAGTTAGDGVVWVTYTPSPYATEGAELRAYDATPVDGVMRELASYPIGVAEKFTVPATDNGRVYVGNAVGHVFGFGAPTPAPIDASPTDFGTQAINTTSASSSVTLTNPLAHAVTVTGVTTSNVDGSVSSPFAVTNPGTTTLAKAGAPGSTLQVPVTFAPTAAGEAAGNLNVATTEPDPDHVGTDWTVSFNLYGRGTTPGLAPNPPSLSFGVVPTKATKTLDANIVNTGAADETVTSVSITGTVDNGSDYSTPDASVSSVQVPAGGTLSVPVTYTPTASHATDDATLLVSSNAGSASVPLSATSEVGSGDLVLTPSTLNLGSAPVGQTITGKFVLRNHGNIALTIEKDGVPAGPIQPETPLSEGTEIDPGDGITQEMTFTPTTAGTTTEHWNITADDGTGVHTETLTATATDPIAAYYAKLGGKHSRLGRPTLAEHSVPGGRARQYQHGNIYWSPATGAHEVEGHILTHFLQLGGVAGWVGFPTTSRRAEPHDGHCNSFAGGNGASICYSPASGAWSVNGTIRSRWLALKGPAGRLGYPESDEYAVRGGRRSNFQHGHIRYDTKTHSTTVVYTRR